MGTWVLLKHETGVGEWHYDLLLDARAGQDVPSGPRPDDEVRDLIAFRVPREIGETWQPYEAVGRPWLVERMEDHRRRYLWFEGDIGRGRGTVRNCGGGGAEIAIDTAGSGRIEPGLENIRVRFVAPGEGACERVFTGRLVQPGVWTWQMA